MLAETRRREITESLRSSGSVTVAEVEARFSVSPVTARRDLDELERRGVLRRTHGGGVLPTTSAHEDSFARRLKVAAEPKRRLAEEAVALMAPGETVFLDSSTTSYFVARRIIETGIATTVLTNSFPVMELIFNEGSSADIIGVGGSLRRLTRSFVGPFAVRTVQGHFADRLFLSVKGLTDGGMMTDADALEAEVKRTMIAQAGESTLLVDRSKMLVRGLSVIASVAEVSNVIAHGLSTEDVAALRAARGSLRVLDQRRLSAAEHVDRGVGRRQRAHGRRDLLRLAAVGGLGQHPLDRGPEPVDDLGAGAGEHAPAAVRVERDARAGALDGGGVRPLVDAEQRHDDLRHAVGERAERGPVPAVADDRGGVRHHRVLRDPLLDVDVGRQRAQLRGIAAVADRQEHPHRQRRERVDRRAVERREVGEVLARGHRSERHVDERVVVAGPPVGAAAARRRARRAGSDGWATASRRRGPRAPPGAS